MTIRIGVVDDQELVRSGLSMVIRSQPDMDVVMEAGDGKAALARATVVKPDVLLMDIRMPVMDGIEATRQLTASEDGPKVLILTTFEEEDYIMQSIEAGASGFLVKDSQPEQLLAAIRTVHEGNAIIGPSATRKLMRHISTSATVLRATDPSILEDLTDREREVLRLLARGETNAEVAAHLHVSEATVKTHISHIFAKLGTRDRIQAVVLAYEAGLVRPGEL